MALGAVLLAATLRLAINPWLAPGLPFLTFFLAVMVAAWYGGLGPGLFASLLSVFTAEFLFIRPLYFVVVDVSSVVSLGIFSAEAVSITMLAEQLRRAEGRFAKFMHHLPGLAWIKDATGRYVFINDAAEHAFNLKKEELYGRTDEEVFPALTAQQFTNNDAKVRASRASVQTIETLEQQDGWHDSLVHKFPIPTSEHGPVMVGGIAIDITEYRRAEVALRESEARFRAMADSAPVLIWMSDTTKLCTWFNKPWLEFTGRTMEHELGTGWAERVHPDDLDRYVKSYTRSFDGRECFEMEYRLRRYDDQYRWVLDRGIPRLTDNGDFLGYIGSCIDVTERRLAEEALREQEDRFRRLVNVMPAAMYTIDVDGRITYYNDLAAQLWGTRPRIGDAEVRYCGSSRLVSADGTLLPHDRTPMVDAVRHGTSVRGIELVLVRPDESRKTVSVNIDPIKDRDGIIRGAINVFTDITDRKRAEESLRASDALTRIRARQQNALADLGLTGLRGVELQTLVDQAVSVVAGTLEVELCKVLELMPDSEQFLFRSGFGWQKGLVGHALVPATSDSQAGYTLQMNEPVVVDDLGAETRFGGPALLHSHHVVSGLSCIIWGPDHRPWGVLGAHSTRRRAFTRDDINFLQGIANVLAASIQRHSIERVLRVREEELRAFTAQLERLVAERTEALSQSQDRLRILAAELNLAEYRERQRLATELHDHLQQLLVLGRLKLGQSTRVTEPATCEQLIKETNELLADALNYTRTLVAELSPPVLREHGLAAGIRWLGEYMTKHDMVVTVTPPDDKLAQPELREDQAIPLFQSVRELLLNSAKHAGTHEAWVTLEHGGAQLIIEVKDNGVGFDLAADSAAETPGSASSRFGLFSVRERMRALGGTLKIQTERGHGTIATLTMPVTAGSRSPISGLGPSEGLSLSDPALAAPVLESPSVAGRTTGVTTILLVDDHAIIRDGLRSVLEEYQELAVVGEAGNGEEAVAIAERLRPDVVVMDINMPRMTGIEATAKMKARLPEVIVIGLSVNAERQNQMAMLQAGAAMLLPKEAAVEELYAAIQSVKKTPRAATNVFATNFDDGRTL
jgi:PAS domain S-box-containing protein